VQSASSAIRYSARPVDGVPIVGIELIGHGKQAGKEADVAFGDARAVGADDAADESAQPGPHIVSPVSGSLCWPSAGALSAGG